MYFLSAGTITKSPHSILQEKFLFNSDVSTVPSPRPSANLGLKTSSILENLGAQQAKAKEATTKVALERPSIVNKTVRDHNGSANNNSSVPATK